MNLRLLLSSFLILVSSFRASGQQFALDYRAGTTGIFTQKTFSTSSNKLLGTLNGSDPVAITLGTGLSFSGSTLNASGSGLTIGTTTITSGTNGHVLYNNAGTLGEVSLASYAPLASPTFTGTITGASLSLSGSISVTGSIATGAGNFETTVGNISTGSGTISGNGSGITALNASNISSGTLNSARLADGSVTSAKITDGTLVNADVSASAAIDGSKIAATTQTVSTDTTALATTAFVHDAAGAMPLQQRILPCGTHTEHANDNAQSNGTDTTTTSRTRVYVACDCTDAQVLLTNIWGSTSPAANGFSVTVKAAIEINSVVYPLFIRGSRTAVLAAGGMVLTDPFAYRFTAGDAVFLRVNATVTSGDKWPRWAFFSNGVDTFETGADRTDSGSFSGTNGYSYRASGFYARPTTLNQGAVAILGDSISAGAGGNTWMNGFIQRAFGGDYGKSVPHAFAGASGETIANWIDQTKTIYRLSILRGCTSALVQLGINDVGNSRTATQMQNDLLTLYARLRSLGIRRIYQTTITPRTTSTDSWATVGNQTPHANEAARVTVNNWIRANTAGIEGFFEIADIVESARDSGRWKAGYTADGLHPNDATHTLMAAGISTAGLLQLP